MNCCNLISCFIDKVDIYPLMCAADEVWITELTFIHKNIRSFRNSHVQLYRSPIKTITNNNVSPIKIGEILAIMSVSTLKVAVILSIEDQKNGC